MRTSLCAYMGSIAQNSSLAKTDAFVTGHIGHLTVTEMSR